MGELISFKRPDAQDAKGYMVKPAQGSSAPGIVVIQEWWGLNDQIKGVADQFAAAGYRVLVPDLYRGKLTLAVTRLQPRGCKIGLAAHHRVLRQAAASLERLT